MKERTKRSYKPDRIALVLNFFHIMLGQGHIEYSDDWVPLSYKLLRDLCREPVPLLNYLEELGVIEAKRTGRNGRTTRTGGKSYRFNKKGDTLGRSTDYRLRSPHADDVAWYKLRDPDAVRIWHERAIAHAKFPPPSPILLNLIHRLGLTGVWHSGALNSNDNINNINNINNTVNYYDTREPARSANSREAPDSHDTREPWRLPIGADDAAAITSSSGGLGHALFPEHQNEWSDSNPSNDDGLPEPMSISAETNETPEQWFERLFETIGPLPPFPPPPLPTRRDK
jgi:hypothetical protein